MQAYPVMCQLLRVCVLQLLPFGLQAQYLNSGYSPLVPTTTGASTAPVVLNSSELDEQTPPPAVTAPLPSTDAANSPLPKMPLLPEKAWNILNFWFGHLADPAVMPVDKVPTWWGNVPEMNRQMHQNFSQDISKAAKGEYNSWRETPKGRLALILLLDSFARHIYRNKPQAFIFDPMARALVIEGIQKGDDKQLFPIERAFFYLPLQHAEDPKMQALSVASYQQLLLEAPPSLQPHMQSFLQLALLYQQQIARFGRFPHRNAILGRESTPDEVIFLNQPERFSFQ